MAHVGRYSRSVAEATGLVKQAIEDSTARWAISPRLARWLFVFPIVGGLAILASRASRSLFSLLTDEDRILEWSQFALYLTAAAIAFLNALRLRRSRQHLPALAWVAFTVGCVFIAGEEISWGQRIFGWGTPFGLRAVNYQGETNVHNIRTVLNGVNVSLLVGGLYGMAGWYGLERLRRWRASLERAWLFVPPLFLSSAFGVVFAYKLSRFVVLRTPRYTIIHLGEWAELCFALGMAAFATLVYLRQRAEATSSVARPPSALPAGVHDSPQSPSRSHSDVR